jgi:hypothetical protein
MSLILYSPAHRSSAYCQSPVLPDSSNARWPTPPLHSSVNADECREMKTVEIEVNIPWLLLLLTCAWMA